MEALSRRQRISFGAVLVLGLVFRFAVVTVAASGSPDSRQYHKLGQELVLRGRLSFGGAPLSYVRLPGYPIVSGVLIDRGAVDWAEHAKRATRWNVLFDLGTALLLFGLGRRLFGAWVGIAAMAAVFFSPLGFLLSAYALTESLATFLSTAVVVMVLWPTPTRWRPLSGVLLGFGMLVRFDLITLVPAVLSLGRKAVPILLLAAVVFAPWPIRNQIQFGAPHIAGAEFMTQAGVPIPSGFMQWMRTWCVGKPGEAQLANLLVFGHHFDHTTPWAMLPQMTDSAVERERLSAIVDRLGKTGFDDAVDRDLHSLAVDRLRQHIFRTLISLPLQRFWRLYAPPPRAELPVKISWLGLPDTWWLFTVANWLMYLGAIVGAVVLYLTGHRRTLAVLLLAVGSRTLLHMFAVPHFVGQRYVAEIIPLLLFSTTIGVAGVIHRLRHKRWPTQIAVGGST